MCIVSGFDLSMPNSFTTSRRTRPTRTHQIRIRINPKGKTLPRPPPTNVKQIARRRLLYQQGDINTILSPQLARTHLISRIAHASGSSHGHPQAILTDSKLYIHGYQSCGEPRYQAMSSLDITPMSDPVGRVIETDLSEVIMTTERSRMSRDEQLSGAKF